MWCRMAVQTEQFDPAQVVSDVALKFFGLRRRADGTYMLTFNIDGEFALPDGRRVRIDRIVGLAADQCIGRKQTRRTA